MVDQSDTGGAAGAAKTGFTVFRHWANRQIAAGNIMLSVGGTNLKVKELGVDGQIALLRGDAIEYVPFDEEYIEPLLSQLV